jgi:hypothetical protein
VKHNVETIFISNAVIWIFSEYNQNRIKCFDKDISGIKKTICFSKKATFFGLRRKRETSFLI